MKRIYSIIILAVFTLAFLPDLCAQDKNDDKGFFIGIDGGFASGVSTFKSEKPSLQLNLEGGYRLNKWLSVQLGIGGGKLDIDPRDCCSAHPGINNDRNSYWRSYSDDAWHYYADPKTDGWWYADMTGTTTYYKGAFQVNFDPLSFFSEKFGFEISPRVGTMFTKTELSGTSSSTGNNLSLKKDTETHFLYGGESTLSYKFENGIRLGIFAAVDMLTGDHFDNIPKHVHKDNYIWDAGLKLTYSFGKRHKVKASAAGPAASSKTVVPSVKKADEPQKVEEPRNIETPEEQAPQVTAPMPVEKKEVDVPTFIPVYFANNSAVVADTYKAELDRVAQCLKNDQELRIQLAGYASNVGNVEYNKALSARRCNAVKQYIESKGVDGKKMEIKPCGIDYDAKQAEKARRVDVIVIEVR